MSTVPGCEFALCRREAELAVQTGPDVEPVRVCGLHVTPLLSWGVVLEEADDYPAIAYLSNRPEAA